jgi:hypothetical protein
MKFLAIFVLLVKAYYFNGSLVQDQDDKMNSHWKNETKCCSVNTYLKRQNGRTKRVCKTST